ncbi:hypothetical protein [Dyella sp. 2RAB6]|uniref:hypothetical protein n=1 Tax=Dyella sp. 2RAB6 TaxID=3232992 RepID=UPI003F90D1C4
MLPAALLLCFASALLCYLASPQQRLRAAPLPKWTRLAALACAAGGAGAWVDVLGVGAGLFTALTALMLGWVGLPYAAWYAGREERR